MPELALKTHLIAQTAIAAIVGTRIAFGDIQPARDGVPDILFRLNSLDNEETFDGNGEDLQFPLFEFECRSWKPSQTITLANLVRRALRELRTGATISTTSGNVVIDQLSILGVEDDSTEIEGNGKTRLIYSRTVLTQLGFRYSVAAVT
jgi:hypothetical protein